MDAQDIRFVVFHRAGPRWDPARSLFEQEGVREHVAHYRTLLAEGKLAYGGPFLDGAGGGMMVPAASVPQDEIQRFAAADPAVLSGLLVAEVRPWMIGMRA